MSFNADELRDVDEQLRSLFLLSHDAVVRLAGFDLAPEDRLMPLMLCTLRHEDQIDQLFEIGGSTFSRIVHSDIEQLHRSGAGFHPFVPSKFRHGCTS